MSSRLGRRLLVGLVAAVLAVSGCGRDAGPTASGSPPAPTAPDAGSPGTAAHPALDAFYRQSLAWSPCGAAECASATVPLDYADPTGRVLTLALRRVAATAQPRRGSLFVAPGGPGVDPVALGDWFPHTGLDAFDLVEWTPRGLNASATVSCGGDAAVDALRAVDASPDTEAERVALVEAARSFGAACAAGTDRGLLAHLSSAEDARDLDILRAAVGDDTLNYYGASYSTLLGAWYADLFPGRVGRLVLDSPVDITGRRTVPQAAGFEANLAAFATWCAGRAGCLPGVTATELTATLASWLHALDASPVPAGGRRLSQTDAATGIAAFLYLGPGGWDALGRAIGAARAGDGSQLLLAADALTGRSAGGHYGPLVPAGTAILCADEPRTSTADAFRRWDQDKAAAPIFGDLTGPDVGCSDWPAPAPAESPPSYPAGPPVLVVGATGDSATPYAWAQETAGALASSVLLTYDGYGHVSYGRSACVTDAVRSYLLGGQPPAPGTVCR